MRHQSSVSFLTFFFIFSLHSITFQAIVWGDDLRQQRIVYEPAIISTFGRWHPRATEMLKHAAVRSARRNGSADGTRLEKWWFRQIAAEVWHRAARMVMACMPELEQMQFETDIDMEDAGETTHDLMVPTVASRLLCR